MARNVNLSRESLEFWTLNLLRRCLAFGRNHFFFLEEAWAERTKKKKVVCLHFPFLHLFFVNPWNLGQRNLQVTICLWRNGYSVEGGPALVNFMALWISVKASCIRFFNRFWWIQNSGPGQKGKQFQQLCTIIWEASNLWSFEATIFDYLQKTLWQNCCKETSAGCDCHVDWFLESSLKGCICWFIYKTRLQMFWACDKSCDKFWACCFSRNFYYHFFHVRRKVIFQHIRYLNHFKMKLMLILCWFGINDLLCNIL